MARTVHMLCAYWGFIIISLHLGFHWNMIIAMAKKAVKKQSEVRNWILRGIATAIAGYGAFAFQVRQLGEYLFLKTPFVFFNFDEPLIFFFIDYLAVMGLFVCIGYYSSIGLKKRK